MKKIKHDWILKATLISFLISLFFTSLSEIVLSQLNLVIAFFLLLSIILIGIMADIIGVAVTAANKRAFNSMAAKKISGSRIAIDLISNAPKVNSIFNDIIGDVCNIISGTIGIIIALTIYNKYGFNLFAATLLVTSLIASITIGGKALGKEIAIKNNIKILLHFSKILIVFKKEKL